MALRGLIYSEKVSRMGAYVNCSMRLLSGTGPDRAEGKEMTLVRQSVKDRVRAAARKRGSRNDGQARADDRARAKGKMMALLNIGGLVFSLIGVLLLFAYGMPFHVPMGGVTLRTTEAVNASEIALESRYTVLGYVGIVLVCVGTALQIAASWSRSG